MYFRATVKCLVAVWVVLCADNSRGPPQPLSPPVQYGVGAVVAGGKSGDPVTHGHSCETTVVLNMAKLVVLVVVLEAWWCVQ